VADRIPLPAWAVERLGTQTNPMSPTAYLLGKTYRELSHVQLPYLDHPTCWTKKGRRVVISEQYGMSFGAIKEMLAFADAYGLEFAGNILFQSYRPGHCDVVIWTKKGAPLV
jgi:hypothetical protein